MGIKGENMERKGVVVLGEEEKEPTYFTSLVCSATLDHKIFVSFSLGLMTRRRLYKPLQSLLTTMEG